MRDKRQKKKSAVSGRLFGQLAARNVKSSAKDYFIYFFTLMLSVCLFYSFNSVSTQFASLGLEDPLSYLAFSSGVLTGFSVLVCLVLGALIVYANRFMLRRRKREMGVYATLGMERKDLNKLLMKETLHVGIWSLAAGLVLGVFAAQVLSLLTARLTGISLQSYRFMVSAKSAVLSTVFFGILFLFVYRFNVKELRRMSLLDMLYADVKNETVREGSIILKIFLLLISLAGMLWGYKILLGRGGEDAFKALGYGGILLIAGTVLFFTSALTFAVGLMKRNKWTYYRGINIFTVGQFSARVKTEGRSLALTSILLFLALSLTMLGPGIGKYTINGVENATPYDGTISYAPEGAAGGAAADGSPAAAKDPLAYLEQSGFALEQIAGRYEQFWTYEDTSLTPGFLGGDSSFPAIIGIEDYNRLLALQGQPSKTLGDGEFAISYAFPVMEKTAAAFLKNPRPLELGGKTLTLAEQGIFKNPWENRNVLMDEGTLIVPQSLAESLTPVRWVLNYNLSGQEPVSAMDLHGMWVDSAPAAYVMWTRAEALISLTSDNLLTTYLGIYLGLTFLITTGAALALQQMSLAADNGKRYTLLKDLGVSAAEMRRSLKKQLGIYFGLPLLVAALHAAVVIVAIFRNLHGLAFSTMGIVIGGGSFLVLAVYLLYFMMTYLGSRRILKL